MKPACVLIALALVPATCLAQEGSPADAFRTLTSLIAVRPSVAGQWFDALPEIARDCDREIDRQRIATLVGSFADTDAVDAEADVFATRADNRVRMAWDRIATHDRDGACRLVVSLWGERGSQFPGILVARSRGDVATAPLPER